MRDGIAARAPNTNDLYDGPFGVVLKHLKVDHDDSLTSPISKSPISKRRNPQQPVFYRLNSAADWLSIRYGFETLPLPSPAAGCTAGNEGWARTHP
ncbi:hypothetical protein [Bordetella genomosp. 12]|uniref:hypothetical protein n=1 Tax=Bordetella genomosp. 12 TaxID=463035 RepID=UPI00142D989F|nr:hypothetical protein [Bordetella genomosp. 12]